MLQYKSVKKLPLVKFSHGSYQCVYAIHLLVTSVYAIAISHRCSLKGTLLKSLFAGWLAIYVITSCEKKENMIWMNVLLLRLRRLNKKMAGLFTYGGGKS